MMRFLQQNVDCATLIVLLTAAQGCQAEGDKVRPETGESAPTADSADSGDSQLPDSDGDGWPDSEDCAPENSEVFPAASERCNAIDDDCDGEIDEADAVDMQSWYADNDGDGFGAGDPSLACVAPAGTVSEPGDCDDVLSAVNPAAAEVCDNQLDDDCDGDAVECRYSGEISLDEGAYFIEHSTGTEARLRLAQECDVDGDGWADLVIGTQYYDLGGILGGEAAYVVRGGQQAPENMSDAWASVIRSGSGEEDFFGFGVACGSDLDGDGATSVLVSEVAANDSPEEEVVVYLLDSVGAGVNDVAGAAATLAFPGATWHLLGSGGDIDADGVPDFVIGELDIVQSGIVSYWVHLFPLSITGENGVEDATAVIDLTPDGAFQDFDMTGDYDGDGISDLALGGFGSGGEAAQVSVFSGPVVGSHTTAGQRQFGSRRGFGPVRTVRDRV